jgi:hypothetical protein
MYAKNTNIFNGAGTGTFDENGQPPWDIKSGAYPKNLGRVYKERNYK